MPRAPLREIITEVAFASPRASSNVLLQVICTRTHCGISEGVHSMWLGLLTYLPAGVVVLAF